QDNLSKSQIKTFRLACQEIPQKIFEPQGSPTLQPLRDFAHDKARRHSDAKCAKFVLESWNHDHLAVAKALVTDPGHCFSTHAAKTKKRGGFHVCLRGKFCDGRPGTQTAHLDVFSFQLFR